jgi:hypothetical protein
LIKVDFLAVVKTVELREKGYLDVCSLREAARGHLPHVIRLGSFVIEC